MANPRFNKYGQPSRWHRTHATGGAVFGYGVNAVSPRQPVATDFKSHGFEPTGFNRYEVGLPSGGRAMVRYEDGRWHARVRVFVAPPNVDPRSIVDVVTGKARGFVLRHVSVVETMSLPWERGSGGWFVTGTAVGNIYAKRVPAGWETWVEALVFPAETGGAEIKSRLTEWWHNIALEAKNG